MDNIVTLGFFDGVHRGHQALLKAIVMEKVARRGKATLITFSNHPQEIIREISPPLLLPLEQRIRKLREFGIDEVKAIPFTRQLQEEEAGDFLDRLIKEEKCTVFFLGHDTHVGKGRKGTPAFIREHLEKRGVLVKEITPLLENGKLISSREIRKLITEGKLDEANHLLGYRWSLFGVPVKGLGLGKGNGAPTLNFSLEGCVHPPFGVYVVEVRTKEGSSNGVANIGIAPTLKNHSPPLLEVHLFGEVSSIHSSYEVIPLKFLRPEERFSSQEELRQAIQEDIRQAKKLLSL